MYNLSNSPIFPNRAAIQARKRAASDARIEQAKQFSVQGRQRAFNTLVDSSQVLSNMGIGAAVDTQKLQDQTDAARATGLVADFPWVSMPAAIAPDVVPMSVGAAHVCGEKSRFVHSQAQSAVEANYVPTASMPRRAPNIVQTAHGPMYFRGADATVPGSYAQGHAGPAQGPSFLMDHPWLSLSLVLAGAGVFALSRRGR